MGQSIELETGPSLRFLVAASLVLVGLADVRSDESADRKFFEKILSANFRKPNIRGEESLLLTGHSRVN
jgi:hypothetical protein